MPRHRVCDQPHGFLGDPVERAGIEHLGDLSDLLGELIEQEPDGADIPGDGDELGTHPPGALGHHLSDLPGVRFPAVLGALLEPALRPSAWMSAVDVQRLALHGRGRRRTAGVEGRDAGPGAVDLDDDVGHGPLAVLHDRSEPRQVVDHDQVTRDGVAQMLDQMVPTDRPDDRERGSGVVPRRRDDLLHGGDIAGRDAGVLERPPGVLPAGLQAAGRILHRAR